MPLPTPARRKLFHRRQITCSGYYRHDGLWDIEGLIVDTKSYDLDIFEQKKIAAEDPIHRMHVRITVDDSYVIRDAAASTEAAPYSDCGLITTAYRQLIGLKIGPGFNQALRRLFNGTSGCTHITELMGPIATTAFQTISSGLLRVRSPEAANEELQVARRREGKRMVGSCFGLRPEGTAVRLHFPEDYAGSSPAEAAQNVDK